MAQPQLQLLGPGAPPTARGRSPATLASVCRAAGADLLEVVLAPRGLGVPVAGVCIHDPLDSPRRAATRGEIVLAPGEHEIDELVAAVRDADAAAVVLRRRRPFSRRLLEELADAGVALLLLRPGLPWSELHVLVLSALALGAYRPLARSLSALADTTAEVAGGPVTIEDLEGRVLAFSQGGQDIDAARAATVLGRRVPERWMRELRRRGVIDRMVGTTAVVHVALPGLAPRRALGVRAGDVTVGAVWLAGDGSVLQPAADGALREAAMAAAVHLTRDRVADDLDRRMRDGALRMLLTGESAPERALRSLGLPHDGGLSVVAVRADVDLQRHADLLCAHLRAYRLPAAVGVLDELVYAVVATAGDACLSRTISDWLRRSSGVVHAGMAGADGPHQLVAARRAADRAAALGDTPGELVAYDTVYGRALLADVAALVASEGNASPALKALRTYDAEHGTDYAATLRTFLDAHGDAARTAATLGIHVNTLRYRMRRLEEIANLDLDDPEARLAITIELHAQRVIPGVTRPFS